LGNCFKTTDLKFQVIIFQLLNLTNKMEKNIQNQEALSIVELEERFETTVAALDTARCDSNTKEAAA
jgi:hypothetical protein